MCKIMKIIKPSLLIVVMLPLLIHAQILTDFNEGDASLSNWFGTLEKFTVNSSGQLQLYDTAAGTAWLSTTDKVNGSNEWSVWIKEAFSPSSNNYVRIYLQSDKKDLTQPLNGYFLQLGESGSADAIELFRQDAEQITSICRGNDSLLASSFAIRIKVVRDSIGNWKLFADPSGGKNYLPQGIGYDNTYSQGEYFGIYCTYTSSNAKKVYVDDVYSGLVIFDTISPDISAVRIVNDNELEVIFNEIIDPLSAKRTLNYSLLPVEKYPNQATLLSDGKTVLLHFDNSFQNKTHYFLKADSISDLAGNFMVSQEMAFDYYFPEPYDLVINEIMADPTPSQGLPTAEYLELYNTSGFNIDLTGWELIIGTKTRLLDKVSIVAKGYLILTANKNRTAFKSFGPTYGFSSFSLLNSGQSLILKDNKGTIISEVSYDDGWYQDPKKDNGGWSLEQINPINSCSGSENWSASVNPEGGTPGSQNSVYDTIVFYPKLTRIQVIDNRNIVAFFNQKMKVKSLIDRSLWYADGLPDSVFVSEDSLQKADLFFVSPFERNKKYQLEVSKSLKNCRGLPMKNDTSVIFGIPEPIEKKEVLFNELLVQPRTNGAEYIEIVNHSEKIIDMGTLFLGIKKNHSDGSIDTVFYQVSGTQKIILPGEYYVLTKYPDKVKQQYVTGNPANFIAMPSFPVLTNDSGTIFLKTINHGMIDKFTYNKEMHYALLRRTDGVSLERSSLNLETNDPANWHSASEDYGFGTPADQNSQFILERKNSSVFNMATKIFSPDGDRIDDKMVLGYQLDKPGYSVQIDVFNKSGALIRHLYNNEYLGTSGQLFWDGKTDDHTQAISGVYVVFIQLFHVDGTTKNIKKTVVLANKK